MRSIVTHQNWRGQFSRGTWGEGTGRVGQSSDCAAWPSPTECVPVPWPGWNTNAWHEDAAKPQTVGTDTYWLGSLSVGMRDASGQMYMRNRYYNPQTGQFTQPDPIGLAGGLNSYGFAAGDPVTYTDPYGLCAATVQADTPRAYAFSVGTGCGGETGAHGGPSLGSTLGVLTLIGSFFTPGPDEVVVGAIIGRAASGIRTARATFGISRKIRRQMGRRGWGVEDIDNVISGPHATRSATNRANGNSATAYFNKDGSHVVRDDVSHDIIQLSNRNDPNWIPDATIQNPYRP